MREAEQNQILEGWLNQHKGVVFKVVRAYAYGVMDREDLFQEILLQVWRSIPSFRRESSATTWIYRIALNTAIKWVKKERNHQKTGDIEGAKWLVTVHEDPADERLQWLYQEIIKLDPIDRSITLLLLDDLTYKEMSDILGISLSNVGVKINRIKKYLSSRSKSFQYGIR